jgi:hypothetical protein
MWPCSNTAAYAGVGSFEVGRLIGPEAALGTAAVTRRSRIFAIYNNGNGGFASGGIHSQRQLAPCQLPFPITWVVPITARLAMSFGAIPGNQ